MWLFQHVLEATHPIDMLQFFANTFKLFDLFFRGRFSLLPLAFARLKLRNLTSDPTQSCGYLSLLRSMRFSLCLNCLQRRLFQLLMGYSKLVWLLDNSGLIRLSGVVTYGDAVHLIILEVEVNIFAITCENLSVLGVQAHINLRFVQSGHSLRCCLLSRVYG
jgi:hypothetical protein